MEFETLTEPIEVIVHFALGGVRPLRFLWRGRAHRIQAVRGRWTTLDGTRQCRHYAVTAVDVGNCEITFDLDTLAWKLASVAIDN